MNAHALVRRWAAILITMILRDIRTFDDETIKDIQSKLEEEPINKKKKRWYSPKEASEILEVDLSTLWRWKKRGYLVPIEVGGKRKYKDEDINAILEGRE